MFWSYSARLACLGWLGDDEEADMADVDAFIPTREWGPWVCYLRLSTAAEPHEQFLDTDAATRAVFGLWALRVDSAIQHEDSVAAIGDLFPCPSLPTWLT